MRLERVVKRDEAMRRERVVKKRCDQNPRGIWRRIVDFLDM